METRHPTEGSLGNEFSSLCNHCGVMAASLKSQDLEKVPIFCVFFLKTTLYGNIFEIVLKGFIATLIDVLCANFVKFGRREMGKIVRYLSDKRNKISPASRSRYCADRTQNLPGPAPDNVGLLRVLKILSKSVHPNAWTPSKRKVFPIFGWSLASSRIKISLLHSLNSKCSGHTAKYIAAICLRPTMAIFMGIGQIVTEIRRFIGCY